MDQLATLLPASGALGILTLVILYLLNANRVDRREYQEAIDRAEKRADGEAVRRVRAEERADEARQRAHAAEDRRAEHSREIHALRDKVSRLEQEIASLRAAVTGGGA